jgi:hypothetical protein
MACWCHGWYSEMQTNPKFCENGMSDLKEMMS